MIDDNGSTSFNEIVVCEHQKIGEGRGTCPCPHGGGDEVLKGTVKGEGGVFLHF